MVHRTLSTYTRFPGVKFNAVWEDEIVYHIKMLKYKYITVISFKRPQIIYGIVLFPFWGRLILLP